MTDGTDDGMTTEAEVTRRLDALGMAYERIEIDPAFADTAAFCERYGYELERSANCIVVASKDDPPRYAACVNLATTKLDVNKRVRRLMGVKRLSFASADDTRNLTGMMLGGVTAFGLPEGLPLYVDARVMRQDRVIVGGGSRSVKFLIDPTAFERVDDAQIVEDLAVEP